MTSLNDRPELVGFFSYSREDDQDSEGALTILRRRIQNELAGQLGRPRHMLRIWQDVEAIAAGTLWHSQIENAVAEAVFFIPIVSPRALNSTYCKEEFQKFLEREKALGRSDLVFPVVYIEVNALENEDQWRRDEVLKVIAERQYVNWAEHRYDLDSASVRRLVGTYCRAIAQALRRPSKDPAQAPGSTRTSVAVTAERTIDRDFKPNPEQPQVVLRDGTRITYEDIKKHLLFGKKDTGSSEL